LALAATNGFLLTEGRFLPTGDAMKRFALICVTAATVVASTVPGHGSAPPASQVFFFQGVPDRLLDLCVEGLELATAVPFRRTVHAITLPSSNMRHQYRLRASTGGACDGAVIDKGWFYAFGGDQVIVAAHQWRDGTARSEPLWLPTRPRIRRGETRFVIGHYAAATRLRMTVDGKPIKDLLLQNGGPRYLFKGYGVGSHTFAFRTKDTRDRLLRKTLWMRKGFEFLFVIYGDPVSGYGMRVFSRWVGTRPCGCRLRPSVTVAPST
jgi:hypothetical protein